MVRLHPYQYTAFNLLSGGVRGAQDKYMLDYWGLAFKQAADELRTRLPPPPPHPTRPRAPAARPALGGGDLRPAGVGAGRSWSAIRNHLRPQDGRFRSGARHV